MDNKITESKQGGPVKRIQTRLDKTSERLTTQLSSPVLKTKGEVDDNSNIIF